MACIWCSIAGWAYEWQWSVEISSMISDETEAHPRAYLWIPAECRQVRGVVVGQHNMCEETLFEHPKFRQRMEEADMAIVWISPILDLAWDVSNGCNEALLAALDTLAEVSGYEELHTAPIVPVGHSAMATFPWNFAAWNPERTLAIVSYHGDAPRTNLTGYGGSNLEWGRTRQIDGIPGLMIEGEYEWWEARVNPALAFRMMYPGSCISFLCDVERGHFDVSDRTADYIGLFLIKAMEHRLPEQSGEPLKKLDPRDGWLVERWPTGTPESQGEVRMARLKRGPRRAEPAPYQAYKGDPHDAFWYIDEEMARLTERIYAQDHDMLPQYLSFEQNGRLLPFDSRAHVTFSIPFRPEADGVTFHLKAVYTDSLRTQKVEQHASVHPQIDRICGPVRKIDDTTFVLSFYRTGFNNRKRTGSITLVASSSGDDHYKGTVQELNINVPYPQNIGKRQSLLFPTLPDVPFGTDSLLLKAVSDAGLPVSYYVEAGPAEVVGDQLVFTPIPPRSRFPIKVTVVAWQYGLPGKIQSADSVERSFYIVKDK